MNQIVPMKTVSFVTNILNNNNNSKLLYNYNNIIIIIYKIIIIDEMEIEEPDSLPYHALTTPMNQAVLMKRVSF